MQWLIRVFVNMALFYLLLISCLTVIEILGHDLQKRDNNAEALIDEFIYETVQDLKNKHQEEITIPDIKEKFKKKVTFFKVTGELKGKGGWFRDLTTLKRTGPSEMVETDNSLALGISLGLGDMEFGFKEYSAEVWHIGIHGKMRVSVQQNSVYAHMTMKFDDNGGCKTTLDKIEVRKLDGFHLDMTGLGRDADWLYSFAATFLANKYHKKIEKAVTDRLAPAINAALAKKDICQKFPH